MKPIFLLPALSLALLTGLKNPKREKPVEELGYNYNVAADFSPFIKGEDIEVDMIFYSRDCRPFTVDVSFKTPKEKVTMPAFYVSFSSTKSRHYFKIDKAYTDSLLIQISINASVIDEGPLYHITLFTRSFDISQTIKAKQSSVRIKGSGPLEMNSTLLRHHYFGITPLTETIKRKYDFVNASLNPLYPLKRRVGLNEFSFTIDDPFLSGSLTGNAELRIEDHLADFGMGIKRGNYKRIPLDVKKNADGSYSLLNKENYRYDRRTFLQTDDVWNSFLSNDIYIPVGLGHDGDVYYFLFYFELSNGDTFYFDRAVHPGKAPVGSCSAAPYCVIGDLDA